GCWLQRSVRRSHFEELTGRTEPAIQFALDPWREAHLRQNAAEWASRNHLSKSTFWHTTDDKPTYFVVCRNGNPEFCCRRAGNTQNRSRRPRNLKSSDNLIPRNLDLLDSTVFASTLHQTLKDINRFLKVILEAKDCNVTETDIVRVVEKCDT